MQRVSFKAEALTRESLSVSIQGFILWSVSAKGDGPFTAFTKLGIVDTRESTNPLDKNQKHLLQRAQYRAFQQMLCAAIERHTSKYTLDALQTDQDSYVAHLNEEITRLTSHMGVPSKSAPTPGPLGRRGLAGSGRHHLFGPRHVRRLSCSGDGECLVFLKGRQFTSQRILWPVEGVRK